VREEKPKWGVLDRLRTAVHPLFARLPVNRVGVIAQVEGTGWIVISRWEFGDDRRHADFRSSSGTPDGRNADMRKASEICVLTTARCLDFYSDALSLCHLIS
jgi:hypothetical protein